MAEKRYFQMAHAASLIIIAAVSKIIWDSEIEEDGIVIVGQNRKKMKGIFITIADKVHDYCIDNLNLKSKFATTNHASCVVGLL